MDRPKLRAIEPYPAEGDRFYLRDPLRVSDAVLVVPRAVLYVASLLDGTRSELDVQAQFARDTGEILTRQSLEEILKALDEALFLDNHRSREAQARIIREFHASEVRPAAHAGLSYPGDPGELASYLGRILGEDGKGSGGDEAAAGDLEAIVAPHIDLARGGEAYGAVYRRLAASCRATRFVVLGICHHPTVHPFALCGKDYDTPLGRVRTDRELVAALSARCPTDFLADEIAHRDEHSVEFQMLLLQYLFGGRSGLCAPREFRVLPILCSSVAPYLAGAERPEVTGEAAELLEALRELLGERRQDCLIAAVDFAHLGRQFGQDLEVTDEVVAAAERDDRLMMEHISSREAGAFLGSIVGEKDRRNVCGVPALYGMLRLLGPGPAGRLERYGQAVDRKNHSIVSFAGMSFERG